MSGEGSMIAGEAFNSRLEILENIFKYLDPRELCICAQVCRTWYFVSSQDCVWKWHFDAAGSTWLPKISSDYVKYEESSEEEGGEGRTERGLGCSGNTSVSRDVSGDFTRASDWSPFVELDLCETLPDPATKQRSPGPHPHSNPFRLKSIFLKYCPNTNSKGSGSFYRSTLHSLYHIFLGRRRVYRIAFFGYGMESRPTSKIVNTLFGQDPLTASGQPNIFQQIGFTGGIQGVGSGIQLLMNGKHSLTACFLYSDFHSSRVRREKGALFHNLLFEAVDEQSGPTESVPQRRRKRVKDNVRQVLLTMDGLVYVVNAGVSATQSSQQSPSNPESQSSGSILDEDVESAIQLISVCPTKLPLLVLCLRGNGETAAVTSFDIVERLKLESSIGMSSGSRIVGRHWSVTSCCVDSVLEIAGSLEWLIDNSLF